LRLVKRRGELMSEAKSGAMAAVIGVGVSVIEKLINEHRLATIDVANFNSPSQTVLSGPADDIKRAGPLFEKGGARLYMPLQVSAAFHSRYMAGAAKAFADFLAPMSFATPKIPVIANVTAQPYPVGNASELVKSLLLNQITRSVQWVQSIRFLMSQGVTEFLEMGPGNVLTRSVQQIQQEKDS
jgi:malonyl CoA-acyl carrier protein transacylase